MNDPLNIIAKLLSAEEHPHLREESEFLEAEKKMAASPELQKQFAESKAFLDAHPVLTQIEGMPEESRERIEQVLREAMQKAPEGKVVALNPWEMRKNFAWAAILALLLAGISVLSSTIIDQSHRREKRVTSTQNEAPLDAFYHYAGKLAEDRLPLQYRENGSTKLVSWLENQGAQTFAAPATLLGNATMGCAYLDGPNGKVSLICFNTEEGTVHLFVTTSASVKLKGVASPEKALINEREAIKWHDEENAYLLIAHDKEQNLPEVFL